MHPKSSGLWHCFHFTVYLKAHDVTLAAMALFVDALVGVFASLLLFRTLQLLLPVATFLSTIKAESLFLLVFSLCTYLVTGLAIVGSQLTCALLFTVCFLFALAVSRFSPQWNDDAQIRTYQFVASLASRAPPLS